MATRPTQGGASAPSTSLAALLSLLIAAAIGSAPVWAFVAGGL